MPRDRLEELQIRLAALQSEIEQEWERRRARWRYRVGQGRVLFDAGARAANRKARVKLGAFLSHTRFLVVLTAPVIYAGIVPFVLLDLFVTVYQAICFPVYGIRKVKRRAHIVFDRQYLGYLNGLQKLNCLYCGYGNGVISYTREVAGRTEQYWCPIKHARRVKGPHRLYGDFCDYGDAEGFVHEQERLREELKDIDDR